MSSDLMKNNQNEIRKRERKEESSHLYFVFCSFRAFSQKPWVSIDQVFIQYADPLVPEGVSSRFRIFSNVPYRKNASFFFLLICLLMETRISSAEDTTLGQKLGVVASPSSSASNKLCDFSK